MFLPLSNGGGTEDNVNYYDRSSRSVWSFFDDQQAKETVLRRQNDDRRAD